MEGRLCGTPTAVLSLLVIFSRGARGEHGRALKVDVVVRLPAFGIQVLVEVGLGQDRQILCASQFLQVADVGHAYNFIEVLLILISQGWHILKSHF